MVAANGFEFIAVFVVMVTFAYFFHKIKSLDFAGMVVAIIFGILAYMFGGWPNNAGALYTLGIVVLFFVVGDLSTRLGRTKMAEKHEQRTTENIIGNGGAALLALFFQQPLAFHGAFASALADTMSSEIGMLSKQKPKLITNFQPVTKGTDGGVTMLGMLAAFVGALIIATFYFYFSRKAEVALIILISGFVGSVVDSLLGATLERKGSLNNMQVNFFACTAGAFIAYAAGELLKIKF